MKLAIVTAVWKRPEIFALFAEQIKVLQNHFFERMDIVVCVAGSEGQVSKRMVAAYNFLYVESPNQPLGIKMNAATWLAQKQNPDYCLMIGSDDLIGVDLMEKYFHIMQEGHGYAYLTDCFFFDVKSKRGLYWGGYTKAFNKGKGAGIGRLISNRVLTALRWICWPPGYDRILDTGFDKQIDRVKCAKIEINCKRDKVFALDIKSPTNMTKFEQWDNSFFVNGKDLLFNNLSKELAEKIYGTN